MEHSKADPGAWWLLAGGLGMAVGALLPWAEATTALGQVSFSGIHYGESGIAALVVGAVLAILGVIIVRGENPSPVIPAVVWLFGAVEVVLAFNGLEERVQTVQGSLGSAGQASLGGGFWIVALGLIVCLAGLIGYATRRARANRERGTGVGF